MFGIPITIFQNNSSTFPVSLFLSVRGSQYEYDLCNVNRNMQSRIVSTMFTIIGQCGAAVSSSTNLPLLGNFSTISRAFKQRPLSLECLNSYNLTQCSENAAMRVAY